MYVHLTPTLFPQAAPSNLGPASNQHHHQFTAGSLATAPPPPSADGVGVAPRGSPPSRRHSANQPGASTAAAAAAASAYVDAVIESGWGAVRSRASSAAAAGCVADVAWAGGPAGGVGAALPGPPQLSAGELVAGSGEVRDGSWALM
jgi:hypothetical protein